jgi:catechol 2,3-dioxygenase-like lactoylglutathione lyase family enzyme
VAKPPGITGIQHVAVLTPRLENAERHYADLFDAAVQFRTAIHEGEWVAIDPRHDWEAIRRARVQIHMSFLRAGALTVAVINEPGGPSGPLGHVCIECTDAEARRIRDRVRALGLRVPRDEPGTFRFRDEFGVHWEVTRDRDGAHRPSKRLDLGTGRVT